MSILGNRVRRVEDPRFLRGSARYVADLREPMLHGSAFVTYVRATSAHADLVAVDAGGARSAPGVLGVFTADDVDLDPLPPIVGRDRLDLARPLLAQGRVRFVGELVAAIVSERPEQGADAAELVWADYRPLPAVVDVEEAASDEVLLFPEAGSNCVGEFTGDPVEGDLFEGCDVVVAQRLVNQRIAACPMEPRGAAAAWGDDGRLHVWISCQNPHGVRRVIADHYGLAPEAVHVVAPDVGGGFGAKIGNHPEELLLPWLARQVGRPVRWHETRSESMVGMSHGRAQLQQVEIGGSFDGVISAYRLNVLQDAGAYATAYGAFLPYLTRQMAPGVYDLQRVEANTTSVLTNTTPTHAYRGAGRPEAAAAIERAVDLFATEIGLDPAEVRRRNLVPSTAFPYTTATGLVYDVGDYERALDLALETAGYDELRAEQSRRREAGDPVALGIGLACYVEVTAGPGAGGEFARVDIEDDGSATVYTGTSPHGQGHETAWAMIAGDELGLPLDRVRVVHSDTDLVAQGEGTMGSRSLQLGGAAVQQMAVAVVDRGRRLAADLLEADPADVVLDKAAGAFHVTGTPALTRSWADVAAAARAEPGEEPLRVEGEFRASQPTFPFGAHVAVVEVDTETGRVTLRSFVAVDDAGRVLNPLLAEGQLHGGIAQGIAQALYEEFRYDADGNPVTANLADYAFPSAAEFPSFELVPMETPTPVNPLGAKGIGESGTVGATPAVQNAVCDALAHLGVRHVDLPCTAERVFRAIGEASTP